MNKEKTISGNDTPTQAGLTYLEASRKYIQLKLFHQIATLSTAMVELMLFGGLLLFVLLFLGLALAAAMSAIWDNNLLGYVSVALLFCLLGLIALFLRMKLQRAVLRKLSKTFFQS